MSAAFVTLLVATIINTSLGFFIYFRDKHSRANQLFLAMAGAVALWTVSNFIVNYHFGDVAYNEIANRFTYFFGYLIAFFGLRFTYVYPKMYRPVKLEHFIVNGASVLLLALSFTPLVAGHVSYSGETLQYQAGTLSIAYILGFLGLVILSCRNLLGTMRSSEGRLRSQALYILIAFALTGSLGLLLNLIIPVFYENWALTNIGPLVTIVLVGVIGYSMYQHGLFNIRVFFVRAAAYTLTTVALGMLYVAPVIILSTVYFGVNLDPLGMVTAIVTATVVAANYGRLRALFNRLTGRIFFRDSYDASVLLSSLNKALVSTIDTSQLLNKSSRIIEQEMKPEYCMFVLKDVKTGGIREVGGHHSQVHGLPRPAITEIMENAKDSVILTNMLVESDLKNALEAHNIAGLVRLRVGKTRGGETLGFMLIGERKSGKPYDVQDMQALDTVGNTIVIAMQNALHFEEIQRFNITLQDKVEEATRKLRATNEKLRKLDETKDEFISMASHQLRTPLTSVKGYLSMVLEGDAGKLKPQQEALLKQSFLSSQRMVNLIADLLNLSRLNTGKFVIDASNTDLRDVVDAEIAQLQEAAKAKGIEMKYERPKEFPTLMLDENKIHQVVMNFMDNAIYYTQSEGTIDVLLTETPTAVEYRVQDTGIGVPRHMQKHLFSKFYRADNARRMRPDGTGLGIYMAKKVILAQGGSIIFESEEGKGSTFGFRFSKAAHAPAPETDKTT